MHPISPDWHAWMWALGTMAGAALFACLVHLLVFAGFRRLARRTGSALDDSLVRHSERPTRIMLPLLAVFATVALLPLPPLVKAPLRHAIGLVLIGLAAWLLIALADVVADVLTARYRVDVKDNLAARKIRTQIQVLRRIAVFVVLVVTAAVMMMTFPDIQQLGASLFASAGLAGLVVGLAARPALTNLLAGLQIALTEPIRLDDVVIVEGEWGWIEEIGTTYVVVRIWDLRRLVVPLSYFIEKPFQNWTRVTADLLGTVFVYTDYSVPVDAVRQELRRILQSTDKWDGKVWGLQVTNATEHTMELRALMSAPDSGTAWDLRCLVREALIDYLQKAYPESLPRTRLDLKPGPVLGAIPGVS